MMVVLWGVEFNAILELLVDHGVSFVALNTNGISPMSRACSTGNLFAINLFLDKGLDVNKPVRGQESKFIYKLPLIIATALGQTEAIELLVSRGASLYAVKGGKDPLGLACSHGYCSAILVLLNKGASLYSGESTDFTPNLDLYSKKAPIMVVARHNQLQVLKLLLKRGANLDIFTEDTRTGQPGTPFAYACAGGADAVVQFLIEEHQNICDPKKIGQALLRDISDNRHTKTLKLLLDHGAEIDSIGQRILRLACQRGRIGIVTLLLNHGVRPNDKINKFDGSALHHAAKQGYINIIQLLLDRGADPSCKRIPLISKNFSNITALSAARNHRHKEVVRLLKATIQKQKSKR